MDLTKDTHGGPPPLDQGQPPQTFLYLFPLLGPLWVQEPFLLLTTSASKTSCSRGVPSGLGHHSGQDRVRLLGATRLTKLALPPHIHMPKALQVVSKQGWRGTMKVIKVNPQPLRRPAMKKEPRPWESRASCH